MGIVAGVAIGIGLIVLVGWFGYVGRKRRRQGFALIATQLRLEYFPEDPYDLLAEPFALFEKGDGRGVENVLSGAWQELDIRLFDYWYYEESTDSKGNTNKTYYRFDCVVAPVDAACSRLVIGHENVGTWLAGALTFHDIQFESEDFNKEFNVKSSDKKFANDFIDARMMDWLLKDGEGFSFEVAADRLLCFHRRLKPIELVPLLGTAKAFRDHIPRVVSSLYPLAPALLSEATSGVEAANEARWLAGHWTPPMVGHEEPPPPAG
jgi:hypothetical protein